MILMFWFLRRFTAFGLALLLTLGVWCGGLAGHASAMPAGMGPGPVPGYTHNGMPSQNEGRNDSGFPCVFRSSDFLSQGASFSVHAQNHVNYGSFIPTVPLNSSEQFPLATDFSAAAQNLPGKISPQLFYSVLNL